MPVVLTATAATGEASWVDASTIGGGGSTLWETIAARPRLSPDSSAGYVNLSPVAVTKTLTFTIPRDLTIKNFLSMPVANQAGAADTIIINSTAQLMINRIEVVSGTGPNVGNSFVSGFGISGLLFTPLNVIYAPEINIQLAEGDVLEIDIVMYNLGINFLAYNFLLTYEDGLSADLPTYWVGGPSSPWGGANFLTGAAASGEIVITGSPTVPGDTITLSGWDDTDLTSIGGNLEGAAGGGANQWDTDVTGIENIRDEILANLELNTNLWDDYYIFTADGTDTILISRRSDGPVGNADSLATTSSEITVSGSSLTGGTSLPSTFALAEPDLDLTVTHFCAYILGGCGVIPSAVLYPLQTSITDFTINAVSAGLGEFSLNPLTYAATIMSVTGLTLDAGDTISITGQTANTLGAAVSVCIAGTAR